MNRPVRKPLVAGNWKMNGSRAIVSAFGAQFGKASNQVDGMDIVVCPPFVYLSDTLECFRETGVRCGGQDVSERRDGPYTGDVSAAMLADIGCEYVIVGHSERRELHAEDDEMIAGKFRVAQDQGLIPILCVGERAVERDAGMTEEVVGGQLRAVLDVVGVEAFQRAVVAYEPVWAIGTGRTARPAQAQAVHAFIRDIVRQVNGIIGQDLRVVYGGSVKADNATALFAEADIDGGLVGGASLDPEGFLEICRAAMN